MFGSLLFLPNLHILNLDQNQALRLCLGTTATGAEYGAVSALSINHDCTRLLCGFAKGQVSGTNPWTDNRSKLHINVGPNVQVHIYGESLFIFNTDHHVGPGQWEATAHNYWCPSTWHCHTTCESTALKFKKNLLYMFCCSFNSNKAFFSFFPQFTDHPALAVCNDSGGSVFELSFRWDVL